MDANTLVLSGTGHRPPKVGGYSDAAYARLRAVARDALTALCPTTVISGGALGWDTALAAAACELSIPYWVAVPFLGQEMRWPENNQWRYRRMLAAAARVHVVCPGGYAAWKMQRRNEWMVDNSTAVLALWDGSAGGTGNCVRYAQSVGRPIHNVWDKFVIDQTSPSCPL